LSTTIDRRGVLRHTKADDVGASRAGQCQVGCGRTMAQAFCVVDVLVSGKPPDAKKIGARMK
jgi:hypothetical protein